MSEDDFEAQLRLENLEKQKQETGDWRLSSQGDPYTHVDPTDGTVFEWDSQKNAWFPKIDDDFIAAYQANYGVSENETSTSQNQDALSTTSTLSDVKSQGIAEKKRKANNEPGWFEVDEAHNTNVYVAGLPLDITEEEFVEVMSKCGLIMKDPNRGLYKIKLYRNSDGSMKGDALCCYIKVESVDLALKILDGSRVRGHVIHVERATFQMKGAYDPSKKPRKKKPKEKEKLKKKLEKLFDWRPEMLRGQRLRCERIVIIKNMFDPKEFEVDATLILEYQKDLRDECSKCGEVKKVTIYDTCPLLLRVFINTGRHHPLSDYSRGNVPANELQIYTWMDATLKELTSLVKEVNPDARRKGTYFDFALVIPDHRGIGCRMTDIGSTCSGQKGVDDNKTLSQCRFQIGDFMDIAISPPPPRGSFGSRRGRSSRY
ncbi:LOW QUALITY PROTEIN: 17S U2 SnRNP complex component HTATSF1-like [Tachypleus tridentatus]|uniref:LOW QUALITY PROTEIN: 17S U2 SnRNP complex component HTATSF1-like n=1 Tax=Tachypleus tridentatus TaxID=6853 RepID=UPI003FD536E7